MGNVGLWEEIYKNDSAFYGNDTSYKMGVDWLEKCRSIEDWGCGFQHFRELTNNHSVLGIDGSGEHADVIADLLEYIPMYRPDGIFIRHVLEHNYNWRTLLARALKYCDHRLCLIVFTPSADQDMLLYTHPIGCPVLSLSRPDIEAIFHKVGAVWTRKQFPNRSTEYGQEIVYLVEKSPEVDIGFTTD